MMRSRFVRLVALAAAGSLLLAACGGGDDDSGDGGGNAGQIVADGSSTVFPLTQAAGEAYSGENADVKVSVGESGTGGGFEKFCNGETDLSNASREIKDEEKAICDENGVAFADLQVANDGIAIVVNSDNDWVDCLTVEQLNTIWAAGSEGKVSTWKDVDPSFPDEKLELFGPGTDSGTFDFFTKAINGEEKSSRTDYSATEDDNVTVQGVQGATGALGYFGLSYFEQNQDALKLLGIDAGDGCVTPDRETVQSGEYMPLSRPLYVYVSKESFARDEVRGFMDYFLANIDSLAEQALFVPMTADQKKASEDALAKLEA